MAKAQQTLFRSLGALVARTSTAWDFQALVEQFISLCWLEAPAAIASEVLTRYLTESNAQTFRDDSTLAA